MKTGTATNPSTGMDNNYQINQVVKAEVEQVFPFGVFVCLPDGTQAYVRKRELTQAGNQDPRHVVSEGDKITAVVIALAEVGQNLELSVRWAEPDPWDAFARSHQVGDTVTATIKNLSQEGAYVQLVPGVDGFIPVAELAPWPVERPEDLLWVSDHVEAMITHLNRQTRWLRLSIKRQMQHQANVGGVLEFIRREETAEEEQSEETPVEAVDKKHEAVAPEVAGRVGRVLVVEDHQEVREPLVEWLRRLGFAAEGADSPTRATACLQKDSYGLLLVDLDLAGENGQGIIETLARVAPDAKVAVMSVPESIARQGTALLALGVVGVFVKPLDLDEIHETLDRLGRGDTTELSWSPVLEHKTERARSSFQQLAETMRGGLSLASRFEMGLTDLVRFAEAEEGIVFHLDPDVGLVSIVAQVGKIPLNQTAIYALAESPVRDVIHERNAVFERHVSDRAEGRFRKLLILLPFESCLGVPIPAGGEVRHALFLFHHEPDAFSTYRLRDAQAMATLFSLALESQALERRIQAISPFLLSGQLAAGLGHEVYNRMSGLELQLRNLRDDCGRIQSSAASADLSELRSATDQLLEVALDLKHIVELFRELTRAEQEEEVDVNQVVRQTVQLLRPIARRHRMHVRTTLASDLPPVAGSAVRLRQVFANLILNAIQHTAQKMERWSEGRGVLEVTTAWVPQGGHPIQVCFADNGPGIHRQLWEDIFALGFSTRPGGTGLGLFIARSLAESMGGKIAVEQSRVPTGTTFLVELPAVQERKG